MNYIKIRLFMFLICFGAFHAFSIENLVSKYKIVKIKAKGDYYIIHAEKNDSLFKIISKKVLVQEPEFELLKKGESYYFDFGNNKEEQRTEPIAGIANDLHVKNKPVFIDGNTRIRFKKRFHYRLYTTNNLRGLSYITPPSK